MRYIAVAITDDYSRAFGTFATKEAADAFAEKVNNRVNATEDAEWREYEANHEVNELLPAPHGRVVVLRVRPPRVGAAERFAMGYFEDAPATREP